MSDQQPSAIARWDPELTARLLAWLRPVLKGYHRCEIRGLESFPSGGAMVVSNHSGGMFALDSPIFATGFYQKFGYDRPLYTLGHDILFNSTTTDFFLRLGFIPARHDNAQQALRSGGVVLVFPGGDYDVYRPTQARNKIDFGGRTGYVKAALNADVPIVPTVSIGGHENQLYLSRGSWLARRVGIARALRIKLLPLSIGIPFGLSAVLPVNLPLPTKIVTQVLEPIDVAKQFGADPDHREVDAHIRHVMQHALDDLSHRRRFPVLG